MVRRGGLPWLAVTGFLTLAIGGLPLIALRGVGASWRLGGLKLTLALTLAVAVAAMMCILVIWPVLIAGAEHFARFENATFRTFAEAVIQEWRQNKEILKKKALFPGWVLLLFVIAMLAAYGWSLGANPPNVNTADPRSASHALKLFFHIVVLFWSGGTAWALSLVLANRLEPASPRYWLMTRLGLTEEACRVLEKKSTRINRTPEFALTTLPGIIVPMGILGLVLTPLAICYTSAVFYVAWVDIYGQGPAIRKESVKTIEAVANLTSPVMQ